MALFKSLTTLFLFIAATSCGGGGTSDNGRGDNNPSDTAAISDVTDESVNSATVDLVGATLQMNTIATPANPIGAFVGGGRGNKSIAGLPDYHRFALSALDKISFEVKSLSSTGYMYANLVVDLDCVLNEATTAPISQFRANRKILVMNTFTQTVKDNGYTEYSILKTDPHWLAVGGAGGLPANEPGGSLATFLASYPNACIINGVSADGGMARALGAGCQTAAALATTAPGYCGQPTSGILFILGDSTTLTQNQWSLRKITINNTEYSGL